MASMMVIELSAFSEGFAPCVRHGRRNQNAWRVGFRRLVPKDVGTGDGKYLRRLAPEETDRLTGGPQQKKNVFPGIKGVFQGKNGKFSL